jgi:hypothetical protein
MVGTMVERTDHRRPSLRAPIYPAPLTSVSGMKRNSRVRIVIFIDAR